MFFASVLRDFFSEKLVDFHQKTSHSNRIEILSNLLALEIKNLAEGEDRFSCLDIGCGDMNLAELIHGSLPSTQWQCIDLYQLSQEQENEERWKKYSTFNGCDIPFDDKRFKVALLCDVLHHAGANMAGLLKEATRVADYIVIKDHFEYGTVSRQLLRLMDFIGNWGYGVNIPSRYFTPMGFEELYKQQHLTLVKSIVGIHLYDHLPIIRWLTRPKWQFIVVLKSNMNPIVDN